MRRRSAVANRGGGTRKKIFAEFRRLAVEQGWAVDRTATNHFRFRSPDGHTMVYVGGSSTNGSRSDKNARSVLRRAGLKGV